VPKIPSAYAIYINLKEANYFQKMSFVLNLFALTTIKRHIKIFLENYTSYLYALINPFAHLLLSMKKITEELIQS